MAIVIPSSKTYDRQNPKIRDNVIERIEVGAVEVSPINDYGVVVSTTGNYEREYQQETSDFKLIAQYVGAIGNNYQQFAGATGVKAIFRDIYIKIPIVNDNKAILNVFYGKSKDNENQIKSTIQYKKYTGTKQFKISYSANPTSSFGENSNAVTGETYDTYYSNSETGNVNLWSQENEQGSYKPIKYELSIGKETTKIVSSYIDDITNINSAKITKTQDGNFYEAYITIWVGGEYYSGSLQDGVSQGSLAGNSYNFFATAEKIEPLKVELTVYGNAIGIDLTDKTVYINGETAKKVHSVKGNELIQTANYMVDKNGTKAKAIDKMYGDTQSLYEKGKETATIRCSISDYFNTDGKKEISIDNSTGKMAFDIYDEVIPYVYGAGGVDYPMSTRLNGSEKIFEVLGTKIYYDGAVWQELYLQEIEELDVEQPPYIPDTPEPPKEFDMVIDNIYVENDVEPPFGIFGAYEPIIEVDDYGNTVFFYDTLGLRIIATGITDPSELTSPLQLKKGQSITFYPYSFDGATDTIPKDWKFKIYIPENTKGILTCNDTYIIWGENSLHWSYAPITIEFSYNAQTGVGTINARDKDGDGATKHDVDFSLGVTIEIK